MTTLDLDLRNNYSMKIRLLSQRKLVTNVMVARFL
ncbi:Hypothetical protein FNO222_1552 [Francisella orientalis]|uniref:Uncharacterized protein n=1 Tax=Francisella orientalis TaxID=299583 RepID=A0ABM5U7Y0_9GAMM|nr:hypothetical protein FNO12_1538 [Francisella orientalis FNO12]AKN87622.1 Hypothetical protein FNO24_1540 [Francisella orientalis FNO24]AKN89160.1 Hypothetical protein FNO190_1538 [Francisella orientalis]AKU05919.1 Hypothetical protein FNO01_1538 [Francisella orientalis]QEN20836.1 Hypothetical protein FNO39_1552 [Francisella orientalis]